MMTILALLNTNSTSYFLQYFLHKPVPFIILSLFALANTCMTIDESQIQCLSLTYSLGIMGRLIIGKTPGILASDIPAMINNSKIAVFFSSFIAGTIGFILLKRTLKTPPVD